MMALKPAYAKVQLNGESGNENISMERMEMKTYRMMGPSGPMETTAPSLEKAKSNLRYRLVCEYGLSWYKAREYDMRDLKAI